MTAIAPESSLRTTNPPPGERPDDRAPTAQVEAVLVKLIGEARAERRRLLAQLEANGRTVAKLESSLAGLGVEVES